MKKWVSTITLIEGNGGYGGVARRNTVDLGVVRVQLLAILGNVALGSIVDKRAGSTTLLRDQESEDSATSNGYLR